MARHLPILIVALVLPAACDRSTPAAPAPAHGDAGGDAAREGVPVEVIGAIRGPVSDGISGTATVESKEQVTLTVPVNGTVGALVVEEGQVVVAKQRLARIDLPTTGVDRDRARATLRKAEQDLKTAERLGGQGLVPSQQVEDARYQAQQARLELQRLDRDVTRRRITSPIDGVVVARSLRLGEAVRPGAPAFVVANLDRLQANLRVPERHLPRLRPGLPVEIGSEAMGPVIVQGVVERIAPTVEPETGTVKVTVDLGDGRPSGAPPSTRLRPGMYVRVRIVVDTKPDALLVPKRAIVYTGDRPALFVVIDGEAHKRWVELGYDNRTQVAVERGLELGEEVVVLGHNGLQDGASVKVVRRNQAPVASAARATPDAGPPGLAPRRPAG